MSIYDVFSGGSRPFDKAEWAAQKQAERKEAYELIDATCLEMAAGGDSFRQYLDVQGRFDRYSVNNAILVSAQKPDAAQLKDKGAWKANRVYVDKEAQKITILEPSKEYTRDDGTKAVSYNAKAVYDISETSAKSRQEAPEPKSMRELVSAMIDASPVPFQPVDSLELPAFYDRGFRFDNLPKEYAEMETQDFKGELGSMRDVLGEIQTEMYKSLEKNKPARNKEQAR